MADVGVIDSRREELTKELESKSADTSELSRQQILNQQLRKLESGQSKLKVGPSGSPLNMWERFVTSFGDADDIRGFLNTRFPGRKVTMEEPNWWDTSQGKFSVDGVPIDSPALNVLDVPADLVELAPEIIRLGAQIKGAAIGGTIGAGGGTAAAPGPGTIAAGGAGIIIGGAVGRGAGQAIVETVGKALGINTNDATEVALDIGKEGILGGAGEASTLGFKALSKPTTKIIKKMGHAFMNKVGHPMWRKLVDFFQQSNVQPFVKRLQHKGVDKIMTPDNMADDVFVRMSDKFINTLSDTRKTLGNAVVKAKKKIVFGKTSPTVSTGKVLGNARRELMAAQIISRNGKLNPRFKVQQGGLTQNLLNFVDDLAKNKELTTRKALVIIDNIDELVRYSKRQGLSGGNNIERITKGISQGLKEAVGSKHPQYKAATKAFHQNIAQPVDDLFGGFGKVNPESVTSSLLHYGKSTATKRPKDVSLEKLSEKLFGSKVFIEQLLDVQTAQAFKSESLRAIRTAVGTTVGGVMGGIGGKIIPGLPPQAGAAAGGALAFILSNPRATALYMGALQKTGKFAALGARAGLTALEEAVPRIAVTTPGGKRLLRKGADKIADALSRNSEAAQVTSDTLGARNNNPINLKSRKSDNWIGKVGSDKQGHVRFKSMAHGIRAGYKNIQTRQKRQPDLALESYMTQFAEENGKQEAQYIANELGISPQAKLKDINLTDMLIAISWFESRIRLTKEEIGKSLEIGR